MFFFFFSSFCLSSILPNTFIKNRKEKVETKKEKQLLRWNIEYWNSFAWVYIGNSPHNTHTSIRQIHTNTHIHTKYRRIHRAYRETHTHTHTQCTHRHRIAAASLAAVATAAACSIIGTENCQVGSFTVPTPTNPPPLPPAPQLSLCTPLWNSNQSICTRNCVPAQIPPFHRFNILSLSIICFPLLLYSPVLPILLPPLIIFPFCTQLSVIF